MVAAVLGGCCTKEFLEGTGHMRLGTESDGARDYSQRQMGVQHQRMGTFESAVHQNFRGCLADFSAKQAQKLASAEPNLCRQFSHIQTLRSTRVKQAEISLYAE